MTAGALGRAAAGLDRCLRAGIDGAAAALLAAVTLLGIAQVVARSDRNRCDKGDRRRSNLRGPGTPACASPPAAPRWARHHPSRSEFHDQAPRRHVLRDVPRGHGCGLATHRSLHQPLGVGRQPQRPRQRLRADGRRQAREPALLHGPLLQRPRLRRRPDAGVRRGGAADRQLRLRRRPRGAQRRRPRRRRHPRPPRPDRCARRGLGWAPGRAAARANPLRRQRHLRRGGVARPRGRRPRRRSCRDRRPARAPRPRVQGLRPRQRGRCRDDAALQPVPSGGEARGRGRRGGLQ